MKATRIGLIEMATAMAISGTIGWFVVVSGQPVWNIVFWRCLFGATLLLPYCMRLRLPFRAISKRTWAIILGSGLAMIANWIFLFSAYPRASISIATAVYNLQPFILVALGGLFLGEQLTAGKYGWLTLGFVGLLIVVNVDVAGFGSTSYLIGIGLALAASICWALAALGAKAAAAPPPMIALIHMLLGVVLLAPLAQFPGVHATLETWLILATVGFVHTGIVYILMYDAIHKLPTHLQGALSFFNPVVAVVVDTFAFGHRLQPMQLAGIATIIVAAAGMNGLFRSWTWPGVPRLAERN